jgi:hypothetical protein
MAHPTSPSAMHLQRSSANSQNSRSNNSNSEVPIDPSIAQSPTYPPQSHYPGYSQPEMAHHPGYPGVYGRPEWASGPYSPATPMGHYGHPSSSGPPSGGLVSPVQTSLIPGDVTCPVSFLLTDLLGSSSCIDRLFICTDPRRATAQAPAPPIRRN